MQAFDRYLGMTANIAMIALKSIVVIADLNRQL
jgi:hypothetical protein